MLIESVLIQNITLVYETLDLTAIDARTLRSLLGPDVQPMVMETPDMVVAAYPLGPLIIQVGDKRIRLTLQGKSNDLSSLPLWDIAVQCNALVKQPTILAYGFNYDVVALLSAGNAFATVTKLFVSRPEEIEGILEGTIHSYIPRLVFDRDQTLYDLILEPMDERRVKVHMNSHFELKGKELPSSEALRASYLAEFKFLEGTLEKFFGEVAKQGKE